MKRNVEIKARLHDPTGMRLAVEKVANSGPESLEQVDTFFECAKGRLKLREFSDGRAELISYERPDAVGPAESRYERVPVSRPGELRLALSRSLGERAVVRKRRTLYLAGRTRIHLDEVEGLGSFIELEAVLESGQSTAEGVRELQVLMERLGITQEDLLEEAYVDLLPQ